MCPLCLMLQKSKINLFFFDKPIFFSAKKQCPINEEYSECVNDCATTCRTRYRSDNITCAAVCKTGCNCISGYLRNDDGLCVPIGECCKCTMLPFISSLLYNTKISITIPFVDIKKQNNAKTYQIPIDKQDCDWYRQTSWLTFHYINGYNWLEAWKFISEPRINLTPFFSGTTMQQRRSLQLLRISVWEDVWQLRRYQQNLYEAVCRRLFLRQRTRQSCRWLLRWEKRLP